MKRDHDGERARPATRVYAADESDPSARIALFRPTLDVDRALERLRVTLESGWLGLGAVTAEFERTVATQLGTRMFCATNSCTAALHLALRVLDLPRGAAVATTPITFVSTNHVLLYEGLTPVFCDVEPTTGNMSADSVEEALARFGVRAIVVVHVGGYSADMDRINRAAARHGVPVLEDCAHAFGATYRGRPVGDTDNLCAWSFHAVKNLPMGDGGGVSTNNDEVASRIRRLRWLGIDRDTATRSRGGRYDYEYDVTEVGFKYHMNDIIAAIGVAGLPAVARMNTRRREIASYYLGHIRDAIKPSYAADRTSSCHFIPLFFEHRDAMIASLARRGVSAGMHYQRNDLYPMYRGFKKLNGCRGAAWYAARELTLPMHPYMSDEDVERVVTAVNGASREAR
jgi:dTDP-4-amino-4,6-dideoxygalactose transaminase